MKPSRPRTATAIGLLAMIVMMSSLGGCGWWSRWRGTSAPAAAIGPPEGPAPRSIDEARAACGNYDRVIRTTPYPRDAYLRGILAGKATIRFTVTGSKIDISRVTSTDSAFTDMAVDSVRKLDCRVDRPTVFEIPFSYRRDG